MLSLLEQAILDATGESVRVHLLPHGYVLARHQAPRRPLPRTDRWYLYLARPKASRWPRWLDQQVKQTGSLKRFTDRLHGTPDSKSSSSTAERNSKPGD